ncbi:MAG: nuclear transport factor 2 family protein [Actinomycetaceae bacterium]|nr:nuclear transport factor 2 family protein [Actinomycetaceae bacterium]
MTDVQELSADDRAAIRENFDAQCQAMLTADAQALGQLLTDDYTLTHMTGYLQAKEEWLAQVSSGAMAYHSIEIIDVDINAVPDPILAANTRTNATIWGSHSTWPLRMRMAFVKNDDGTWLASRAVASTW